MKRCYDGLEMVSDQLRKQARRIEGNIKKVLFYVYLC